MTCKAIPAGRALRVRRFVHIHTIAPDRTVRPGDLYCRSGRDDRLCAHGYAEPRRRGIDRTEIYI